MKTKIVKLEFNIIVIVDDDATREDIIEEAREELIEIVDDTIGIDDNVMSIKDDTDFITFTNTTA